MFLHPFKKFVNEILENLQHQKYFLLIIGRLIVHSRI